MKALVLREHGGNDKLAVETDYPDPEPGEGDVVLQVRATSLNYHDVFTRRGMPGIKIAMPAIMGLDVAGEIVAVGPGVQGWSVGDRVLVDPINRVEGGLMGETVHGGLAELCRARAHQMIRLRGRRIDHMPASRIARLGVCRTFQNLRLSPTLTAFDNVSAGAIGAVGFPAWRAVLPGAGTRRRGIVAALNQSYLFRLAELSMLFVILAASLKLVSGTAGLISLGQAAFYAVGAYTAALLALRTGWGLEATLPAAVLVAGLVAFRRHPGDPAGAHLLHDGDADGGGDHQHHGVELGRADAWTDGAAQRPGA